MTTDTRASGHEAVRRDATTGTAGDAGREGQDPATGRWPEEDAWADDNTWGKALNDEEFSQAVRRVLGGPDTGIG